MKIIILILSITFMFSCSNYERQANHIKDYEYEVTISNDNWAWSKMYCDSFNMINKNEIEVYCKGVKQKIYAGKIRVNQNPYK